MKTLNDNTPVSECIRRAYFTESSLRSFAEPELVPIADRLAEDNRALVQARAVHEAALPATVTARANLGIARHRARQAVRRLFRLAELADGRKAGPIATRVFPEGLTPVVQLAGRSLIEAMQRTEGLLAVAAAAGWHEASEHAVSFTAVREAFEAAVVARDEQEREEGQKRAARDEAKRKLIARFASVAGGVREQFPRDRATQNLFFHSLRDEADMALAEGEAEAATPAASDKAA